MYGVEYDVAITLFVLRGLVAPKTRPTAQKHNSPHELLLKRSDLSLRILQGTPGKRQ